MSLHHSVLVFIAGLATPAFLMSADPRTKPKLDGQHPIIAMERNGVALDEGDFKGATLRFSHDKIVGSSKDGVEFLNASYTLDTNTTPCGIVLVPSSGTIKDKQLPGLIERKDNTIRLIFAHPGGKRPTDFQTKDNQVMYTLRAE